MCVYARESGGETHEGNERRRVTEAGDAAGEGGQPVQLVQVRLPFASRRFPAKLTCDTRQGLDDTTIRSSSSSDIVGVWHVWQMPISR